MKKLFRHLKNVKAADVVRYAAYTITAAITLRLSYSVTGISPSLAGLMAESIISGLMMYGMYRVMKYLKGYAEWISYLLPLVMGCVFYIACMLNIMKMDNTSGMATSVVINYITGSCTLGYLASVAENVFLNVRKDRKEKKDENHKDKK